MSSTMTEVATKLASTIVRGDLDAVKEIGSSIDRSNLSEVLVTIKIEGSKKNVLHIAASRGTVEILRYLTELVPELKDKINETDAHGFTVLHRAAFEGGLSNVKYLCELDGIDVDKKSNSGCTPLDRAAFFGNLDCVKHLKESANADIYSKDNTGSTPLHTAAGNGKSKIVDYFCNIGYDCNIKNDDDKVPLELAIEKRHFSNVWPLVFKTTEFDFNRRFREGNTLLHMAITEANIKAFDHLSQQPNAKNLKNDEGVSPFDLVIKTETFPLSKLLNLSTLSGDKLPDVNHLYRGKKTLLHIAVEEKNQDALTRLCKMDGIKNVKDDQSRTPFDIAAADLQDENQLIYLTQLYKLPEADITDINRQFREGKTLLHVAVLENNEDQVRRILKEHNESIDLNTKDEQGNTVLHQAVKDNRLSLVELFLKHKSINVNITADDDTIPLSIALENEYNDIMVCLLTHHTIDIDFKDNHDYGVLQILRRLMVKEKEVLESNNDHGIAQKILKQYLTEPNILNQDLPNSLKNLLEPKEYVVTFLENVICEPSTNNFLKDISAALKNIIIIGLQKYAANESLQYVFFKPEIYVTIIKVFLDRSTEEDDNLEDTAKILSLVFLSLQSNITCDLTEKEFLKQTSNENSDGEIGAKLNKDVYVKFKKKIFRLASECEKNTEHSLNDVELIATKIWNTYFEEKKVGCLTSIKTLLKHWSNAIAKCTGMTKLFHKCSARSYFAVIPCLMGIIVHVSDIVSDVIVGVETLVGFSTKLGILILALSFIALVHENVRSSYEQYETEEQSIRTKLGKYKLEPADWMDNSELNYTRGWFFKRILPFRFFKENSRVKVVVFNLLSILMMRPVVDRLIVLVHSKKANLRNVYRAQSKQRALNQYFMILEQMPELLIQFYVFQIFFNIISTKEPECKATADNLFDYEPIDFDCSPNLIIGVYICTSWIRVYSMAVPFMKIPKSLVSVESSFRVLDPHAPKMSTISYIMVYIAYMLMIPSRLFLFAGMMHASYHNWYIIVYMAVWTLLWLIVNGVTLHKSKTKKKTKKTKKSSEASTDSEQSESFTKKILKQVIKYWTLLLFSFRDIVVISLRDPIAYMSNPSDASYTSLRCWTKLMTISAIYFVEGLVGAVYIEEYYPCGMSSHLFKYQGWVWLILCIVSSGLLIILSYTLQPPLKNVIPKDFKSKASSVGRFVMAMCIFSGLIFILKSFTTKILIISICTIIVLIYRFAVKCIRLLGEAKKTGGISLDEKAPSGGQTACSCFPCLKPKEPGDYTAIVADGEDGEDNHNQAATSV